ncbi:hypothetical protein D3C81_682170 [compost metagenome]
MVDPGAVHAAGHLRHFGDQRALEAWRGRLLDPVDAEIFQADGRRQLLGDDERMLGGRVAAALTIGDCGHGRHADFVQALDGLPFLAGTQHRQLGAEQVLEDLAPADAAVDLDEKALASHFGTQRAAPFQLAIDLALQRLHGIEGITPGPQALERFGQYQLHADSCPRITSAACCGMLYRSAVSANARPLRDQLARACWSSSMRCR